MRKESRSIEPRWQRLAETAKQEALKLPPGRERDILIRKARQLETASRINGWLSSPELTPPK